jgi:hypothetical protein
MTTNWHHAPVSLLSSGVLMNFWQTVWMYGAAGCWVEASGSDSRQTLEIFQAIVSAIATSVTRRTRRATRLIPMHQSYRGGLGLSP